MKYYIQPFGCQMNRSDSERIRTVLNNLGYEETGDEKDPQIAIKGIISCSVRQQAIDRVYGRIRVWNREKNSRTMLTFITGCVLPADREKFLKLFDLVFPIEQLTDLPDMIRQYGVPTALNFRGGGIPEQGADKPVLTILSQGTAPAAAGVRQDSRHGIEDFWKVRPSYGSVIEAYVPIQNGCDKFCTFCAVPYTRGREVSRPSDDILEEVRGLVESGCRSITLLGQNVNSYGLDRRGAELTFTQLMKSIGEIGVRRGGGFWTYFTSPHPRDINRELLETMASYDVLAKWIHLPLQSGDDKVLLKMNRNHSMDRYRGVVHDIRSILPEATLFTDIIVGFSGETQEQFERTAQAMAEFRYDMAYIARYSPRPGAASSRWEDDVPAEEKERRYRELSEILLNVSGPVNREKLGKVFPVLVTGENRQKGYFSGYTEGRIPVRIVGTDVPVGEFSEIEVTSARPLSVEGRVVRSGIDQVS